MLKASWFKGYRKESTKENHKLLNQLGFMTRKVKLEGFEIDEYARRKLESIVYCRTIKDTKKMQKFVVSEKTCRGAGEWTLGTRTSSKGSVRKKLTFPL